MPTLTWIGKEKVMTHHQEVPFRVLEHKYGFRTENSEDGSETNSGNMVIHGDNLEALKALLPKYEGGVKCIYIDPPYNTGNEKWVYNDNVNHPKIRQWLGEVVGQQGEDLSRHDKWLCMMYPRLTLLRKLLADDGVIFISIDDNEFALLKLICDEIFGLHNFIAAFKWNRVAKAPSLSNSVRTKYEYVFAYYKKERVLLFGKESYNTQAPLWHLPNKQAELLFPAHSIRIKKSFDKGVYGGTYQVELLDDMVEESGVNKEKVRIKACSAWGQEKINSYVKSGNTFEIKKSPTTMYTDLSSAGNFIAPSDLISLEECNVKRNTDANDEIKTIGVDFNYSKPTSLPEYLCYMATYNKKNAIVLDSFAGSGTTAHAVMNLNKKDGGNRKFILVEMEDYADTITAERVKRVMKGYGEGNKAVEGTGGEFDYYELGEPLFVDNLLNEAVEEEKIREYIYYSETKKPLLRERTDEARYMLDTHNGTSYYFYYKKGELTTLSYETLSIVVEKAEAYVIYADVCTIPEEDMKAKNITFKKIPRDINRV